MPLAGRLYHDILQTLKMSHEITFFGNACILRSYKPVYDLKEVRLFRIIIIIA